FDPHLFLLLPPPPRPTLFPYTTLFRSLMAKKHSPFLVLFLSALSSTAVGTAAQNREPNGTVFHVTVDMVQLDVAVTDKKGDYVTDRKSTRLNSSHLGISYAVFCLKKKK